MIVGLDMGGTHVDAVLIKDGQIIETVKRTTIREDIFSSIWTTLEALLQNYDSSHIKRIHLSTTVSTNAIVENKTEPVGMIIQAGPGVRNDFSPYGTANFYLSGYVDHRGIVVDGLKEEEIKQAQQLYQEKGIGSCAIVTKFSTRNPKNELRIAHLLANDFDTITLGHRMSGKLNFPRRVATSYLNSAVSSTFHNFSHHIKNSLQQKGIEAPVFILKADGGTMNRETAEERPVETILSGPAASFMGMSSLLPTTDDAILLDIGGTTTDIFFLSDGVPLFQPLGAKIGEFKTLVRAIHSVSIGLGGDSNITIEDNKVVIGPERAGLPYALGGPRPTPSDAMIFLGLMDVPENGTKEKAKEAMTLLGTELSCSIEDVATLILTTMASTIKNKTDQLLKEINSKPVYTVKELLQGKKIVPKLVNMIGGPSQALAPFIEAVYNLPCYFPPNYGVANAIGAALAKPTMEITLHADTAQGTLTVPELGIYEKISTDYSLAEAKTRAMELLKESAISKGSSAETIESEITEESSFNMVQGFYTTGKNIRVKAQIKPGQLYRLRSNGHES